MTTTERQTWRRRPTPSAGLLIGGLGLLLTTHGCGRPRVPDQAESPPPFSFRRLDLQQRTREGQPAWTLQSPEARYDLRSSVARALQPEGVIFQRGKPFYRLGATTGTVINDGAVILLEGAIRLQRLGGDPLVITADRALWIPRDALMRFELGPQVRNTRNRLSSQTATLHLDRDLLELRGAPFLEHWSRPFPLTASTNPSPPEIIGTVKAADWRPNSGDLKGEGPVRISRRPRQRPGAAPPQVLTATRLVGNTLRQLYTLEGPVRIDDPAERGWFRGGGLTLHAKEQWLTSATAFAAQRGELRLWGENLRLDGQRSTASIGSSCQLERNGDRLQAQRCQWNWQSQALAAEGDVLFQRQVNRQRTRAQRLQGQLGPAGTVRATSPGGRVVTELQVPRRAGSSRPARVPAKPEPIVF